mmetsp:Transcript_16563/g.52118  ORF Transcript_16563/g.52118 Transcript_16563/m.52118 type:complete len:309 (+) Transcript_16563:67-993(+)
MHGSGTQLPTTSNCTGQSSRLPLGSAPALLVRCGRAWRTRLGCGSPCSPPRELWRRRGARRLGLVHSAEAPRQVDAHRVQLLHDEVGSPDDGGLVGLDVDLRIIRLLVRGIKTCEVLDLPLRCLGVEPLGVALLHHRQRRVDEDLKERQRRVLVDLPRVLAVALVRGNEAADHDGPCLGKELCDLGDAADVLLPVLWREAQVPVQAVAEVVPVEAVDEVGLGLVLHQGILQRDADRALAASGEARHPERDALVAGGLPLLLPGDALVELDVIALLRIAEAHQQQCCNGGCKRPGRHRHSQSLSGGCRS